MDNAAKLLALAKEKFGGLTTAEEKLFRAAATGEEADYSAKAEEYNDLAKAENWGPERVIKASRVEWLCTSQASGLVTHRGIDVKGLRIDEDLALQFARIPFPLFFEGCAFTGIISLQSAEVRGIYLDGTHTRSIWADGIEIAGGLFLRNGFKAEGEVRLLGATIKGSLECDASQFSNPKGKALSADGVSVGGSVFLREGFEAKGEVRLLGATIKGDIDCIRGQFSNPKGKALSADNASVGGWVFLNNGFKAEGEVCLLGATIKGDLNCIGGRFNNPEGYALSADGASVGGSVFLREDFKAEGKVVLIGATIAGYFQLWAVNSPEKYTLDLRYAKIKVLYDEEESWPEKGKLHLDGLVYETISDGAPRDARSRIRWLELQPEGFRPQPYEQLAAVLRRSGDETEAKKILIAKEKAKTKRLNLLRRLPRWVWWILICYGYRPGQAVLIGAAIVMFGWGAFQAGFYANVMTPTRELEYVYCQDGQSVSKEARVSKEYPKFNTLIYSLDEFLPIVDLHQASYWQPNAHRTGVLDISQTRFLPINGSYLRAYLWFEILAGWVVTTLLVASLTKLPRS